MVFQGPIVQPTKFIRSLFPKAIWRIEQAKPAVYLTFDDGPTPGVTNKVLRILSEFHVKATFFCIGKNVIAHPNLYQQIIEQSHAVGNHTFNHLKGWNTKNVDYFKNIKKCDQVLNSTLFRPPYGQLSFSQYRHLVEQYQIVFWDVLTYDWNPKNSPEFCLSLVKDKSRNGSIIVYHDSEKAKVNCLESLPYSIEYLLECGYEFKCIE